MAPNDDMNSRCTEQFFFNYYMKEGDKRVLCNRGNKIQHHSENNKNPFLLLSTNMASSYSSLHSSPSIINKCLKHKNQLSLKVRAHGFRYEGRPSSIVDENLRVLRERMENVRVRERLERCCRVEYGWNYASGYNFKRKKEEELSQFLVLVGLVGGTLGLTFFTGTVFLGLVSLLLHLSQ